MVNVDRLPSDVLTHRRDSDAVGPPPVGETATRFAIYGPFGVTRMEHSPGPRQHREHRTVPKNSTLERITHVPSSLNDTELEEACRRVRCAVQGLDPATAVYVAVTALVGKAISAEIAVTHPGTGDILFYVTPATLKLTRDVAGRSCSPNNIPSGGKSSLDDLLRDMDANGSDGL
jgi:hypothetical protein